MTFQMIPVDLKNELKRLGYHPSNPVSPMIKSMVSSARTPSLLISVSKSLSNGKTLEFTACIWYEANTSNVSHVSLYTIHVETNMWRNISTAVKNLEKAMDKQIDKRDKAAVGKQASLDVSQLLPNTWFIEAGTKEKMLYLGIAHVGHSQGYVTIKMKDAVRKLGSEQVVMNTPAADILVAVNFRQVSLRKDPRKVEKKLIVHGGSIIKGSVYNGHWNYVF